jgi:hypothetical protein
MLIRSVFSSDWIKIREICCATGSAGQPIDPSRNPFFGELWTRPYRDSKHCFNYVVQTDERLTAGYLTGCADTRALEQERFFRVILPLALGILVKRYAWNSDTKRFLRQLFHLEKTPQDQFKEEYGKDFLIQLEQDYPAHLHVNLLKPFRSSGVGAQLVEAFCADLSEHSVKGVHLYCGDGPLAFYQKNGFEILASIQFKPHGSSKVLPVHALGRKLILFGDNRG